MKKTKFWIPLIATTSLSIISPIISSSCSDAIVGQINKEQQIEMLNSEAAKTTLLDSWLTTTFSSLYAENIKPSNSLSDKKLVENTIRYYFDYLTWPTTTSGKLVGSNETINFADETLFSSQERQEFVSLVQEAYLFYINFMSTIQPTQSSDSSTSAMPPSVYFKLKSLEWQKNKYKTLITIEDKGQILTINDFNPSLNYTGMSSTTTGQQTTLIETDYKILMSTRGTLIYQNVLKLLLSQMYFLKSTKELVENGTNFKKLTNKKNTDNYINTMAYVGENNDFSSYLFKKYCVENSPQFTWSYSSTDYDTKTTSASIISTIQGFNNLKTTKETSLSTKLVPNSTENSSNSLTKLQAFNSLSLVTSSEETLEGDLSISLDSIKTYGSSKIGLLDKGTNKLFTFSNLEAIKKAREYNSTTSNASNPLMIPSINIKSTSLTKYSNNILVDDIEVLWGGQSSQISTENNKTVFKYGNQQIVINSISYNPSKETKEITISFTYSFNTTNTSAGTAQTTYSFDYDFKISNWGDADSEQINPFANSYIFAGQPDQVGIKIFNEDSTPTGITYYLRVLPLFTKTDSILIGNKWYMRGKFGFENTPWKNEEDQRKLVYFLMLSDSNLYSKIQDFYLFNNFNVTGNTSELSQQISNLGLNKKTDADRRKEGII